MPPRIQLVTVVAIALVLAAGCGSDRTIGGQKLHTVSGGELGVFDADHFPKIVSALADDAGADALLTRATISIGEVRFDILADDGLKTYTYDEGAKQIRTADVPGTVDVTQAFPLAGVDVKGPQRMFDGIVDHSGRGDLRTLMAELSRDSAKKLRWSGRGWAWEPGKGTPPTGAYEASPAGTLIVRPAGAVDLSKVTACIRDAGGDATKVAACQRLVPGTPTAPVATRAQKYAACVGRTKDLARIRHCQKLYRPEQLAYIACRSKAATDHPAIAKCLDALQRARARP